MTDTVCGTVKQICFALEFPTTPTYGTNEIINGLKHVRLAPQSKFPKANETCGYNKSFHFFKSFTKLHRFQQFIFNI